MQSKDIKLPPLSAQAWPFSAMPPTYFLSASSDTLAFTTLPLGYMPVALSKIGGALCATRDKSQISPFARYASRCFFLRPVDAPPMTGWASSPLPSC